MGILQIERKVAVDNIGELLAVPVVDAAVIGPFDLMISPGENSTGSSLVDEVIGKVVEAARRHGVASGIRIAGSAVIIKWQARGMAMSFIQFTTSCSLVTPECIGLLTVGKKVV